MEEKKQALGNCTLVELSGKYSIIIQGGKSLPITAPEGEIVKKLYENSNEVVSKEELIIAGWGNPDTIGSNSLPVAITNLRKILELEGIKIVNIPRKGYLIKIPGKNIGGAEAARDSASSSVSPEVNPPSFTTSRQEKIRNHVALLTIMLSLLCVFYIAFSWVTPTCEDIGENQVCYLLPDNQKLAFEQEMQLLGSQKKGIFYVAGNGDKKTVFHHE